jgi:hypothetical protein
MAWKTIQCSLGHNHRVYVQKKTDECAIACAAMVIERLRNIEVSVADLRQASQAHSGGYRPSAKDAGTTLALEKQKKGHMDYMAAIMVHALGSEGSGTVTVANLPGLLNSASYNLTAVPETKLNGADVRTALKNVSNVRKYVVDLRWDGSTNQHAVMVDRRTPHAFSSDEFCICDPGGDGLVHVATLKPDGTAVLPDGVSDIPYTVNYGSGAQTGHVKLRYVKVG